MLIKTKNGFEVMSGSVLLEFLKMHTDKSGKVTERIELAQFVPITCCAVQELKTFANNLGTTPSFDKQNSIADLKEKGGGLFHWVFSSYALDRANERMDCSGWDIANFEKNPVVLWAHNHFVPAIGYAQNVQTADDLQGDVIFNAKDFDAFGWSVGERVAFGSIRAGSVGFLIKEIEFVDKRKNPDEKAEIIYRKQELLEFSICNVPANPAALFAEQGEKGKQAECSAYDFLRGLVHGSESSN